MKEIYSVPVAVLVGPPVPDRILNEVSGKKIIKKKKRDTLRLQVW